MDWSAFWGAFLGTLINLFEVGLLLKILKEIRYMVSEFKEEGEDKAWLK